MRTMILKYGNGTQTANIKDETDTHYIIVRIYGPNHHSRANQEYPKTTKIKKTDPRIIGVRS